MEERLSPRLSIYHLRNRTNHRRAENDRLRFGEPDSRRLVRHNDFDKKALIAVFYLGQHSAVTVLRATVQGRPRGASSSIAKLRRPDAATVR